jgi:hypothetical protein
MDGDKFAKIMDLFLCKECNQYKTGCKPQQIVDCTAYFINTLAKIVPPEVKREEKG